MKETATTINDNSTQIADVVSVRHLINRIIPNHAQFFEVNLTENDGQDYFKIIGIDNKIKLEAPNPVSLSSALNWYLKYECNCHISWSGDQLSLPDVLPIPSNEITHKANFQYRYYLNYCTFSYSMPWWNWERWEREIDWMVLNGINLPLALVGQEAVWQNLLRRLGLSEEDIFKFLPGPAYTAWNWLGNLDGWGGPTTQNWIDSQKELQLKILARLREFKITPVLQAFTGRVPKSLKKIFPDAKIEQLPGWYGYDGVYFLDPNDPLFFKLSSMFIEEQTKLYGNDHYFAGDVFHEIESPSNSSDYLKRIYKGIQDALIYVDSSAKWVLQSWSIRDDNIDILDEEHTLILDLYCDSEPKWKTTKAFHGHPWVWSIINNFGGRVGMGGKLETIAKELPHALNSQNKGRLVGIGMAPEGIGNNPVIYDLITEMNWNSDIGDIEIWLDKFSQRRYGIVSDNIKIAWHKFLHTVYQGPKNYPPVESIICALPSLNIEKVSSNGSVEIYYDANVLLEGIEFLLKEKEVLSDVLTYKYDVVDITRQLSVSFISVLYSKIIRAYNNKNIEELNELIKQFIELSNDLDDLLSGCKYLNLATWLNAAKDAAKDENDIEVYEWNARRQITLWSSPEITEFHDYANKQWGGLIKEYYLPRWKSYFALMKKSLLNDEQINDDEFKQTMMNWAEEWSNKRDIFAITNNVDSIKLAEQLLQKYQNLIIEDDKLKNELKLKKSILGK